MNQNDPVFIDITESDKPLSFVGELATSALAVCIYVFILCLASIFGA